MNSGFPFRNVVDFLIVKLSVCLLPSSESNANFVTVAEEPLALFTFLAICPMSPFCILSNQGIQTPLSRTANSIWAWGTNNKYTTRWIAKKGAVERRCLICWTFICHVGSFRSRIKKRFLTESKSITFPSISIWHRMPKLLDFINKYRWNGKMAAISNWK